MLKSPLSEKLNKTGIQMLAIVFIMIIAIIIIVFCFIEIEALFRELGNKNFMPIRRLHI